MLKERLGFRFRRVVADSGYESLGNYRYLDQHKQEAYIKPNNYESSRTRKFKAQIGRAENMGYYAPGDYYLCRNGRILDNIGTATEHGKGVIRKGRHAAFPCCSGKLLQPDDKRTSRLAVCRYLC